jgi:GNAT superfamily N-acetyltransferase
VFAGEQLPMLNDARMRIAQMADLIRSNGWSSLFKEVFFLKRTAIVVEKDLSELTERSKPLASAKLKLLEIDKEMLSSGVYRFAVNSRYLKALNYLKHGYGGYALARDNVVVGDTWHYVAEAADNPRGLHEDLQRFGFDSWSKDCVYTFDIFVAPAERRGGISAAFQNSAMLALRSKGYTKAYGFYWADNIPAQWCTRVTNKWKEMRAFNVSRCLMFRRAVPLRKDQATHMKRPPWLKNIPIGEKKGI